jgi:hypothetical protein
MIAHLLSLTLALSAPNQPAPVCSRVVSAAPVHSGMYAGVTCPESTFLVSIRAGQRLPALGRARIVNGGRTLQARNGAYQVTR